MSASTCQQRAQGLEMAVTILQRLNVPNIYYVDLKQFRYLYAELNQNE